MTEQEKWKKVYKQAMKVCHTDRAPEHLYGFLEKKTKELTEAWRVKDFVKLREIAIELDVKNIPSLPDGDPTKDGKDTSSSSEQGNAKYSSYSPPEQGNNRQNETAAEETDTNGGLGCGVIIFLIVLIIFIISVVINWMICGGQYIFYSIIMKNILISSIFTIGVAILISIFHKKDPTFLWFIPLNHPVLKKVIQNIKQVISRIIDGTISIIKYALVLGIIYGCWVNIIYPFHNWIDISNLFELIFYLVVNVFILIMLFGIVISVLKKEKSKNLEKFRKIIRGIIYISAYIGVYWFLIYMFGVYSDFDIFKGRCIDYL